MPTHAQRVCARTKELHITARSNKTAGIVVDLFYLIIASYLIELKTAGKQLH